MLALNSCCATPNDFDVAITQSEENVISAAAADATKQSGKAMSGEDNQGRIEQMATKAKKQADTDQTAQDASEAPALTRPSKRSKRC